MGCQGAGFLDAQMIHPPGEKSAHPENLHSTLLPRHQNPPINVNRLPRHRPRIVTGEINGQR